MLKIKIGEFHIFPDDSSDTRIAKEYLQLFCRSYSGEISAETLTTARDGLTGPQRVLCIQLLRNEAIPPTEEG